MKMLDACTMRTTDLVDNQHKSSRMHTLLFIHICDLIGLV